jgi:hypothetical protein
MDISKQQKKAIKKESGKAYLEKLAITRRGQAVMGADDLRDKLDMSKLLNADDTSELEALFNTL